MTKRKGGAAMLEIFEKTNRLKSLQSDLNNWLFFLNVMEEAYRRTAEALTSTIDVKVNSPRENVPLALEVQSMAEKQLENQKYFLRRVEEIKRRICKRLEFLEKELKALVASRSDIRN